MNPILQQYAASVESRLIESPTILSYQILRCEISSADAKLRIKASLKSGGQAEFFMYIAESTGRIETLKYSFHWQDARGNLIKRWDNAPHYPQLQNAPHHIHEADQTVHASTQIPDFFYVIDEIEHDTE